MKKVEMGNICRVVKIDVGDSYYRGRKNFLGKKVKLIYISIRAKCGFMRRDVITQENIGELHNEIFRKGEIIYFYQVRLKKIE